ncbi:glycerate kinase [Antarcticibacterium sp. 1MA-6-2]|uniref:glycerate kinase n=1 Tax=Antarcticibacterium sp. 1MA-6-2 TaxID=2908210 RepID=UPI001F321AFA|nr:glycerate kinase [Antarcticibacterium sp. 1MA-6-2]UJH90138.1 glycerate kinase [Antarcticibacterium sp. 1MA-6-2]
MKKIVIASDSFKGSVTSMEVADAAETAIKRIFPGCEVVKTAVADGGEGTIEALVGSLNGTIINCTIKGPLMEPVTAHYGILGDNTTAVIEMASASGLTLIPEEQRNPLLTSTFGTGELIKDALERGCRKFLIGIGGSATNDAGTGMLQALGFKFLNKENRELKNGGQILKNISAIDRSEVIPEVFNSNFTIACDVENPLTGPNGAAHVYAKQKGADDEMIAVLEEGMKHFAQVIAEREGKDIEKVPGA